MLFASTALVGAEDPPPADVNFAPNPQAREVVRRVVANELRQEEIDNAQHYMFKLTRINQKGSRVQEIAQTDQGNIARTLLVDGQPLGSGDRQAEQQKLENLLRDQDLQRKRMKQAKDDAQRAEIMVKALPNAFYYEEIGREGDIVKFRFRPDPNYDPQSREESVYTGMAGELWLDVAQNRLRKIDAHLFHDVDFGWGILGRLYKGGSFMVEQKQVEGDHWDTVAMKLDLNGKALFFKSLIYKEQEYESDFHRLPDHITLAQGLEALDKETPEVAEKGGR
ncbi:MAG TPA: hypothetical protein VFQ00_00430 [Terriglobales bacterium]|nr:hypothetical protein [Terriglobales bacterium]